MLGEPGERRRRSDKVSGNQTREALQTKRLVSKPEISAEPGDFSEGKGQHSPPKRKNIKAWICSAREARQVSAIVRASSKAKQ